MVYKVIFKKRCRNKLEKLLIYIENELGLLVAQKFAVQFQKKINMLQQHPFVGKQCITIPQVRSIHVGKYNRLYYKLEASKIIVVNMYDTRIHLKKNKLR